MLTISPKTNPIPIPIPISAPLHHTWDSKSDG